MKTAKQWQKDLAGETSIQSIQQIQADALLSAALIVSEEASTYAPLGLVRGHANKVFKRICDSAPTPILIVK